MRSNYGNTAVSDLLSLRLLSNRPGGLGKLANDASFPVHTPLVNQNIARLSIMFWLLFCAINRSDDSTVYSIASNGVKDVESETSSVRKRKSYQSFCLIFAMSLVTIPFLIAMMSRLDSCHVMFNSLYH